MLYMYVKKQNTTLIYPTNTVKASVVVIAAAMEGGGSGGGGMRRKEEEKDPINKRQKRQIDRKADQHLPPILTIPDPYWNRKE